MRARRFSERAGALRDGRGEEVFVIPVKPPAAAKFEDIKNPGPIAGSLFNEEEKARIVVQDPPPAPKKK